MSDNVNTNRGTDCSICKSNRTNRALTDTCLHEYCFDCIRQWSLNNNRCPLCRTVYHNIWYKRTDSNTLELLAVSRRMATFEELDRRQDRVQVNRNVERIRWNQNRRRALRVRIQELSNRRIREIRRIRSEARNRIRESNERLTRERNRNRNLLRDIRRDSNHRIRRITTTTITNLRIQFRATPIRRRI